MRHVRLAWLPILALTAASVVACGPARDAPTGGSGGPTPTSGPSTASTTVTFLVPTISCPTCVARVEASAKKVPGVLDAKASLATKEVVVTYDPTTTDPETIAEAIRQGGDTVEQPAATSAVQRRLAVTERGVHARDR